MRPRTISGASLAASLLVLSLWGCAPKKGGFQMPPTPVEVATVQTETVRDRFRSLGSVEANETVKIVSEVNAVVRALPFTEGQVVRRGQVLARLDDAEIGAEALRANALRDQAKVHHQRVQQLFEQKAASPQELDDASAAFKVAQANARLGQARLAKTRITSPLNGMVGRRLVSPGAFLRVGDTITEVAALDQVKISFAAPERFTSLLHTGSRVEITTTAHPGQIFVGKVNVVDPILDPQTRTVQLVAIAPNPGRRLRPGMSADVSATLAEREGALTIPDEAVFAQGDQSFVYVVAADTVSLRPIGIASRDSARVEVSHGLAPGDVVVRAGYQKLYPGAHVMAVPAGGAGPGGPGGAAPSGSKAGGKGKS